MEYEAFSAFIRNTTGDMPWYTEEVLSEDELKAIHAYLQSIPAARDPKTIPLLQRR